MDECKPLPPPSTPHAPPPCPVAPASTHNQGRWWMMLATSQGAASLTVRGSEMGRMTRLAKPTETQRRIWYRRPGIEFRSTNANQNYQFENPAYRLVVCLNGSLFLR